METSPGGPAAGTESPGSGWLGQRSVAFWTVVAGVVAVIGLGITIMQVVWHAPGPLGGGPTSPVSSPGGDGTITVPTGYQGRWSGVVARTDGTASFQVDMQVGNGHLAERIGTVTLLNGNCRGFLSLEATDPGSLTVREVITYNGTGTCSTIADLQLALRDKDSLNYSVTAAQYVNGQTEQGSPVAAGVLARQ